MNIYAINHVPKSNYAFAYKLDTICVRLRTEKGDIDKVYVIYGDKFDWANREKVQMRLSMSDSNFDYYEAYLTHEETRFGYLFELHKGNEKLYYSEDGLTKDYNFEKAYYSMFQYPYINKSDLHIVPEWAKEAIFYQIFVERFFNGDKNNKHKKLTGEWGELPNPKSFFGGDIKGITKNLDYLSDLGITAIYLTPIFKSPSNHKYDTTDYFEIDEAFGTKEDFKELVNELHKRGMRIVLDAVFNHCGINFEPFQDVVKNGENSKYADWFHIDSFPVNIKKNKHNYKTFAQVTEMPKLNTSSEGLRKYLIDVSKYWIEEFDIDGWRLDVSDEIEHDFWREFRKAVKGVKEDIFIVGENWHNSYPWLQGDQFDSVMNYPITKECLAYFANGKEAAKKFSENLSEILIRNTEQVNEVMLNLLDSHDTERFLTMCNGNKEKLKNAVAFLMTFEGIPCTYYGSEIGMEGGYDPDCRRVFDWNKENWDNNLRNFYKKTIEIRKEEKALTHGSLKFLSTENVFIMERSLDNISIFTLINNSGKDEKVKITIDNKEGVDLLTGERIDLTNEITLKDFDRKIIKAL